MDKEDKHVNTKVAKFSKRENKTAPIHHGRKLPVKEGFPYSILEYDINGFKFNDEHLRKYAQTNTYTISLCVKKGKDTFLYNYFVDNDCIGDFFKLYLEGKIEGDIIEIDKFNPEILA